MDDLERLSFIVATYPQQCHRLPAFLHLADVNILN